MSTVDSAAAASPATSAAPAARIVRAGDGEVLGPVDGCRDRFLVDAARWGGRLAVVEHLLAPRSLAAPLHRHTREDEFSWIVDGEVTYRAGDEVLVARAGDLVIKPRGEWHTFWNATDRPARVLELICPGGLEVAFRLMDTTDVDVVAVGEQYGCAVDLEATAQLLEQHGLTFG